MRRKRLRGVGVGGSRGSWFPLLKLDLIVLAVLCVVGAGYFVQHHPIRLSPAEEPRAQALPAEPRMGGDVLLFTPDPGATEAAGFEALDFAANWHNILGQEVGVYRSMARSEFTPAALSRASLVVVPGSVAAEFTVGEVATIEEYVEQGGLLLVELPTAAWQALVGVVVDPTQIRSSRRITAFDGALVRGALRDDVIERPLRTKMAPVQVADVEAVGGAVVLLEVDGLPGLVRRPVREGEVFAAYFDLARSIGIMQQGTPAVDWDIARPSAALPSGFTRSACLVSDPAARQSDIPSADLLERNVLSVVTSHRPLPRVWPYPGTRTGAFIMTHSALPSVREGTFMLVWEAEQGLPATVFARADDPHAVPASLRRGLLAVPARVPTAPMETLGILGFQPFARPLSLEHQLRGAPATSAAGEGMTLSRMIDGLWDPTYGRTFQTLAGLGVDLDSTYGPAYQPTDLEAAGGYSFGTGLPFYPVDLNGNLVDVLEMPIVLHDGAAFDREWADRLIVEAGTVYNELIVADWRTGTMLAMPRADVVTAWREAFRQADANGMWITDLETFARFWQLRGRVRLESEFSVPERRLTVLFETPAIEGANGEPISPSLAFEALYEGREVERITNNGQDIPFVELGRSADEVFYVYGAPEGTNRLEITYQGPIEIVE